MSGNAEVPGHLGHRFTVQEKGDKSEAFAYGRTLDTTCESDRQIEPKLPAPKGTGADTSPH
jgi:hypothetical protein